MFNLEKNIINFWKKVDKETSTCFYNNIRCWEWIAGQHKDGYGNFLFRKRMDLAHRVSWVIHYGEIEKDLYILHKCDNRKCVNPNHLFLGTQKDNMTDMILKGREDHSNSASGIKNGSHTHPEKRVLGEDKQESKLKNSDIIKIREIYSRGNISQLKLGKLFGISQGQIGRILRKEQWKHI